MHLSAHGGQRQDSCPLHQTVVVTKPSLRTDESSIELYHLQGCCSNSWCTLHTNPSARLCHTLQSLFAEFSVHLAKLSQQIVVNWLWLQNTWHLIQRRWCRLDCATSACSRWLLCRPWRHSHKPERDKVRECSGGINCNVATACLTVSNCC